MLSGIADWKLHHGALRMNDRTMPDSGPSVLEAATHPASHVLLQGGESVQRSENAFFQIASDEAIE